MPSIEFKNFTHREIVAARKEILDTFFNPLAITRTVARWVLKDRSILLLFIRLSVRNRISERLKQLRRRRIRNRRPLAPG
jgi:hypothetical protein